MRLKAIKKYFSYILQPESVHYFVHQLPYPARRGQSNHVITMTTQCYVHIHVQLYT